MTNDSWQNDQSCALAVYYADDWGAGCNFTLKDINDYSTAILETCATGDMDKIGGHAQIAMDNCSGQIEIIRTPPGSDSTSGAASGAGTGSGSGSGSDAGAGAGAGAMPPGNSTL